MAVVIILAFSLAMLGSFIVAVPTLVGRMSKRMAPNIRSRSTSRHSPMWDPRWDDPPPTYQAEPLNSHPLSHDAPPAYEE